MTTTPSLTLSAESLNGAPLAGDALTAQFDTRGGTVGRADTNQLVLPDPERTVSRVHAQIAWREGYVLIDRGSNPVTVNGHSLDPGEEARLSDGDAIQVGGYVLRVSLGDGAQTTLLPAREPAPTQEIPTDIFADLDVRSAESVEADPFADLLGADATGSANGPTAMSPLAGGEEGSTAPIIPETGLGMDGGSSNLDEMFGLQAAGQGQDPFADLPDTAAAEDPLAGLLGGSGPPPAATIPDDVFEIDTPFVPPREVVSIETVPVEAEPVSPEPLPTPALAATVAPPSIPVQAPVSNPPSTPPSAAVAPPFPAAVTPSAPASAGDTDLDAALRRGLGVPDDLALPALTPALAQAIGVLLRESTQGTLDLLLARAATKREVRAESTMIIAKNNNPLKFSPTVEVALQHLLAPTPARGFMAPTEAMRDAYDDLRAHQFGFMAGMRAALEGLLGRFDPAVLEQRLAAKTVLDKLPMARRARLWDLFAQLYDEISREAADNFHQAFGKAFLQAYQEQIDSLDKQRNTDR